MVNYCVAFGCKNTCKDNVSVFRFPTNQDLRVKWIQQVRRTKDGWSGPTENSVICSCHFSEDSFEPSPLKFGIKKRVALKKEAIPTIFKRPPTSLLTELPPKKQTRKAAEKLTNARVSTIMLFYLWLYTSHADC